MELSSLGGEDVLRPEALKMDQPALAPTETPVLDRGDRDEAFVVVLGRLGLLHPAVQSDPFGQVLVVHLDNVVAKTARCLDAFLAFDLDAVKQIGGTRIAE